MKSLNGPWLESRLITPSLDEMQYVAAGGPTWFTSLVAVIESYKETPGYCGSKSIFFFQMFPLIKKVSWEVSDFCRFGVEKDTLLDLLDSCSSFARLILKVWPSKDHRLKVGTRICSVWGTDEGSKHEGALALPRMVKQMHRTNAKTKELWYSYYFVLGSSYILKIS